MNPEWVDEDRQSSCILINHYEKETASYINSSYSKAVDTAYEEFLADLAGDLVEQNRDNRNLYAVFQELDDSKDIRRDLFRTLEHIDPENSLELWRNTGFETTSTVDSVYELDFTPI